MAEKSGRDPYARAALIGLGLFFTGLAIITVGIALIDIAEAYFLLFFLVPGLIVTAALFFWRRWGLIVGALGSAFGLLILMEDIGLVLGTPSAFFDFAPTVFAIAGLAVALVASLTGSVQYARKAPATTLASWQSSALRGLTAALVVLAVVSGVLMALNTGSVSASDAEGTHPVVAKAVKWEVETISATPGDVKILLKNRDAGLHTFTIYDLDIDVKMGPWTEQVVVLEGLAPGTYGFVCRIFDHEEKMTGVITVAAP